MTFDGQAPEPIGDETVLGYWSGSVVGSDGLTVPTEWSTASPIGHWLDDDLGLKLPLLNIVPKEVSHSVQWLLTDRRVVMLARGRSRFATGVLHVRFEWMSGVITERYADRAGKRKPTASIDVMIGNTEGQQFSLPINPGSDGVQGERVLMALREALSRSHLELGEARHRNSGGKHGTLARDFRPVPGVGPGIPTTLLGTLGG